MQVSEIFPADWSSQSKALPSQPASDEPSFDRAQVFQPCGEATAQGRFSKELKQASTWL
jgi:hypothetical protein